MDDSIPSCLDPLDDAMDPSAEGEWRDVALDRVEWKKKTQTWITQMDVAWRSGAQEALPECALSCVNE